MSKDIYLTYKKNLSLLKELALERDKDNRYIFGPLPLTEATKDFEFLVKSLLDSNLHVVFYENEKDLMAIIFQDTARIINVTQILLAEPDLEYINFSTSELNEFHNYLNNKTEGIKPSKSDFSTGEEEDNIDQKALHQGEKLAINIYTTPFFSVINRFFRSNGRELIDNDAKYPNISTKIKDILLIGSIATTALSKLPIEENASEAFRIDGRTTIPKRTEDFKKNVISYEKSFYSSSNFKQPTFFHKPKHHQVDEKISFHLIIENGQGSFIKPYSYVPSEEEILFGIGTKFAPLVHAQEDGINYFVYKPVRALGIKSDKEDKDAFINIDEEKVKRKIEETDPLIEIEFEKNGSEKDETSKKTSETTNDKEEQKVCLQEKVTLQQGSLFSSKTQDPSKQTSIQVPETGFCGPQISPSFFSSSLANPKIKSPGDDDLNGLNLTPQMNHG